MRTTLLRCAWHLGAPGRRQGPCPFTRSPTCTERHCSMMESKLDTLVGRDCCHANREGPVPHLGCGETRSSTAMAKSAHAQRWPCAGVLHALFRIKFDWLRAAIRANCTSTTSSVIHSASQGVNSWHAARWFHSTSRSRIAPSVQRSAGTRAAHGAHEGCEVGC